MANNQEKGNGSERPLSVIFGARFFRQARPSEVAEGRIF